MRQQKIATRYAKSLLDLAKERGVLEQAEADIKYIHTTISENEELQILLKSPVVNTDKKIAILNSIFGAAGELVKGFVNIITTKKREQYLHAIAAEYLLEMKRLNNILPAYVITAVALDEATRAKIVAEADKLGAGTVELTEKVDPSILGGYVLRVNDNMVDASVASKLNAMKRELITDDYIAEI